MQGFLAVIDKLNKIVKFAVSIIFMVLAILVFFQVITRFVINYPIGWSEEISRYLMVYIVFLGSALAIRNHQHIAIDFLPEIISYENKRRLNVIIMWVCAIFFATLSYYGLILTLTVVEQITPTLQFSMAWAYASIPIGSILMLLNVFANLIELRLNRKIGIGGEAR